MSPELVARCRARYGSRWQSPLARDICAIVPGAGFRSVLRTVQRYAAGDACPPPISEAAVRLLSGGEGV